MISQYDYQVICDALQDAEERTEELKELVDMVISSESADKSLIPAFYHSFLHKAKQLKEQSN